MRNIVHVPFGAILPLPIHAVAVLGLLLAFVSFSTHPLAGIVLALMAFAVFTAREGTEIDLASKRYREYHSVFFVRGGQWTPYNEMEKLYLNRNRMKQRLYAMRSSQSSDYVFYEYSLFLKFDDDERIPISKSKNKKSLWKLSLDLSSKLNTPLYDNTGDESAAPHQA